jgi:hypothetical protein
MADSSTIKVDPNGDVIFVLPSNMETGGDDDSKLSVTPKKVLVSSKVLSRAEPVFSAMFSPSFQEGTSLRTNSAAGQITQINLPDDQFEDMFLLVQVLHHKFDVGNEERVSFPSLEGLVPICHNYNCVNLQVIRQVSQLWLEPRLRITSSTLASYGLHSSFTMPRYSLKSQAAFSRI